MPMKRALRILMSVAVFSAASATVSAYERYVFVNGARMNTAELAYLDALHGEYIPNGRYWLNLATGQWGYEGGPAEGYLGQADPGGQPDRCAGQPFANDCRMARGCEQSPELCSPIMGQ